MTTVHQQVIPPQSAASTATGTAPATVSRRHRTGDLPEPEERRRLRERWGLTTRQVATAFGVTPATVRSWERGRSAPRGSRREAYRRFLAGLAQYGGTSPHRNVGRDRPPAQAARQPTPLSADPAVPALRRPATPGPTRPSAAADRVVRVGAGRREADPVAPERVRRVRLLGAVMSVWSLALWVYVTCPPPL
ncbi:helix-turn-helix domain-containing protein [Streptomyces sp. NPDC057854]|uniref:helix-turn-helix domain-containing protein n=1 Tax=unclassified Streptomyces TaxID=2593676 RepID=UPI00369366F6